MKETPIKTNSRKAMHYRGAECLNCGHPLDLTDRFCSYCGQMNTTKRLAFSDFFAEFFSSIFTYDSKFRYTIKDLLFKPGSITRYYVDGKRLMYANPFRFFLSISIVYFVLFGLRTAYEEYTSQTTVDDIELNISQDKVDFIESELSNLGNTVDSTIVLNAKNLNPEDAAELSEFSADLKDGISEGVKGYKDKSLKRKQRRDSLGINYDYYTEQEAYASNIVDGFFKKYNLFTNFYKETDISDPNKALDSLKYSKGRKNLWLYSRMETIDRIEKNPSRFGTYIANKVPFFLYFFLE